MSTAQDQRKNTLILLKYSALIGGIFYLLDWMSTSAQDQKW